MKRYSFPKDFLWGASTSSHQVEGGVKNDWSEWEHKNASRLSREAKEYWDSWQKEAFSEMFDPQNYISGIACDHYNRFSEDFQIASDFGHNASRISLEWSRIEPEDGVFDEEELAHYKEVVKCMRSFNLEPFIVLWHWPLPLWLRDLGGWESPEIVDRFVSYTEKVLNELGEDLRFWITLNEPEVYTSHSYLHGSWPPGKKSKIGAWRVYLNLIKAHRSAYAVIKRVNSNSMVGVAKNNVYFEAYGNRFFNRFLKCLSGFVFNDYFLNKIKNHQDFIGLNYYFHNRINYGFDRNENLVVSDLGWELYPNGIYNVLVDLKKYRVPIYVVENGLADAKDEKRSWFILETLKAVHRAMDEGADVRGYLHWSLMDNFEWDKGFWPRFGLLEIDRKTLERKPRDSMFLYRDIILSNGFDGRLLKEYGII